MKWYRRNTRWGIFHWLLCGHGYGFSNVASRNLKKDLNFQSKKLLDIKWIYTYQNLKLNLN